MTHAEWHAKVTQSLALAEQKPKAALRILERLAIAVESEERKSVADWHVAQTLGVISIVQSQAGNHRESSETLLRVAERHEQTLRYEQRALVSACAAAALVLTSVGDRAGALRALRKAAPWAASLRPKDQLLRKAEKAVKAMARRAPRASRYRSSG